MSDDDKKDWVQGSGFITITILMIMIIMNTSMLRVLSAPLLCVCHCLI